MARKKVVVQIGITSEEMESAFAEYCTADAKIQNITSKMDVEMTRIREKYQDELTRLGEVRQQAFDVLQAFGTEKREELFSKKKSMETTHGILGFRMGTPKLKTRKGYTWKVVTDLLKEFLPSYVRISEEPAKDKLLADRDVEEVSQYFTKVGILVDQDETFFVEPKKEEAVA